MYNVCTCHHTPNHLYTFVVGAFEISTIAVFKHRRGGEAFQNAIREPPGLRGYTSEIT